MRAPRETRLRLGPALAVELHELASDVGVPPTELGRLLLRGGMALLETSAADLKTAIQGAAAPLSGP
jgi:hypothetical protein